MTYGKGAVSGISGVALLPFTGNNSIMLIVAATLIAVGAGVLALSLGLARKSRSSEN